jgi:hypothetical protein
MLLTMLLHSVFGCGWHHLHACESGCISVGTTCHPPAVADKQTSNSSCRSQHPKGCCHHPAEEPSAPVHDEHHTSDCDHSVCSFVFSQSMVFSSFQMVSFVPAWMSPLGTSAQRDQHLTATSQLVRTHSASQLCAQLQVWRT